MAAVALGGLRLGARVEDPLLHQHVLAVVQEGVVDQLEELLVPHDPLALQHDVGEDRGDGRPGRRGRDARPGHGLHARQEPEHGQEGAGLAAAFHAVDEEPAPAPEAEHGGGRVEEAGGAVGQVGAGPALHLEVDHGPGGLGLAVGDVDQPLRVAGLVLGGVGDEREGPRLQPLLLRGQVHRVPQVVVRHEADHHLDRLLPDEGPEVHHAPGERGLGDDGPWPPALGTVQPGGVDIIVLAAPQLHPGLVEGQDVWDPVECGVAPGHRDAPPGPGGLHQLQHLPPPGLQGRGASQGPRHHVPHQALQLLRLLGEAADPLFLRHWSRE